MVEGDPNQEVREKFQDSYRLEEEEGSAAKAKAAVGGALDFVKRNLVIIILVLVIGGGLLWYFVLRPQPVSLSVEVSKLDVGEGLESATVSILNSEGRSIAEGITDETGYVSFEGIPSEEDLSISVDAPSSDYNVVTKAIKLKSGVRAAEKVEVDRKTGLKFDNPSLTLNLAPECSKDIQVTLNNDGKADENAELVATESISDYVRFETDTFTVPAGSSASVTANVKTAKEDGKAKDAAGDIRVKYAKAKMKLTIKAGGDSPKLSVSFDRGDAKQFTAKEEALPVVRKSQVSIKNSGKKTAIPLTGVYVEVEGDVAPWVVLDISQLDSANSGDGIAPGDEALIGFEITVPEGTEPRPYDGRFTVRSSCGTQSIPLSVNVQ